MFFLSYDILRVQYISKLIKILDQPDQEELDFVY